MTQKFDYPQARVASGSGAVSAAVLVGAPLSTQKIVVHQIYVSTDFAVEVTFDDTTVGEIWSQFVAASGGSVVPASGTPWFECTAGEALTYSHGSGGASVVAVNYEIVNV